MRQVGGRCSELALAWMVEQAKLAGVEMKWDEVPTTIIANPVIHDKSRNLLEGAPDGGPTATSEDRNVRYMDGTTDKQRKAEFDGMSWVNTEEFITYKTNPNTIDSIAGTVNMSISVQ